MNRSSLRLVVAAVVIFAAGLIIGQLTMGAHLKAAGEARQVAVVENLARDGESLRKLEQLEALGYTSGTVDDRPELRGVVVHDRSRTSPGLNFYSSRIRNSARLIDNDGRELHRWSYPGNDGWEHAELLPGGELLVVMNMQAIFKLDRSSNLLWRLDIDAHHDVAVDSSGEIFALTREHHLRPEIHPEVPVIEDFIQIISPDGEPLRRVSILDALRSSPYAFILVSPQHLPISERPEDRPHLDLLHTNHIQVFDGSLAERSPLFRAGNVLISMRTISTIAILDPTTGSVEWLWGPSNTYRQHDPNLLDNGNILIFDNGTHSSQIVEVDPLSFDVVWRYAPAANFLSRFRGSAQRLANGNTLITESDRGKVFEVTPDGETVWQFVNPDVAENNSRVAIWRMTRFAPGELDFVD